MEKKLKNIQTFEQHTDKNLNISDVMGSFTSEQKRGLQIALDLIKQQPRFESKYFGEQRNGQFIKRKDLIEKIILLLNYP
jgi:hypothetical protein